MAKDYTTVPATDMRRSDRAVDDAAWMKQFLHRAAVGTLATVYDGQPFVNTNLYVYDEKQHCIYTHTARTGRTRTNVDKHERVCFTIMEMGRLLPADEALEFSVEYAGVVIFGDATVVDDEAEATDALQQLLDKYAPHLHAGQDYRPPVPAELKRTAVYKISIDEWSAKKKEVEEHEGAFWYDEQPILQSVQQRATWQGSLQAITLAAKAGADLVTPTSVEVVANKGLSGDRNFGKIDKSGVECHVTLIAQEDLDAVAREHNLPVTHAQTRRNLLTVGVPLSHLVGKRIRIGERVILEGVEIAEPCDGLAKFSGYGKPIISAMLHRGGLRAKVVQGGTIKTGDTVKPL